MDSDSDRRSVVRGPDNQSCEWRRITFCKWSVGLRAECRFRRDRSIHLCGQRMASSTSPQTTVEIDVQLVLPSLPPGVSDPFDPQEPPPQVVQDDVGELDVVTSISVRKSSGGDVARSSKRSSAGVGGEIDVDFSPLTTGTLGGESQSVLLLTSDKDRSSELFWRRRSVEELLEASSAASNLLSPKRVSLWERPFLGCAPRSSGASRELRGLVSAPLLRSPHRQQPSGRPRMSSGYCEARKYLQVSLRKCPPGGL